MAQTILANAVVEVTALSDYQGQTVINVFHYYNSLADVASANGDLELQNVIAKFHDTVWNGGAPSWKSQMVADFTLLAIRSQVVSGVRGYYLQTAYAETGLAANPGIPSDTNCTLSLRTSAATRGLTGNKKFTGLALTTIDGNQFTVGTRLNVESIGVQIRLTLNDNAANPRWIPIVWSKKRVADRRTVVSHIARSEVRVLRRREKGLGI